jgi:hypothetical protein
MEDGEMEMVSKVVFPLLQVRWRARFPLDGCHSHELWYRLAYAVRFYKSLLSLLLLRNVSTVRPTGGRRFRLHVANSIS